MAGRRRRLGKSAYRMTARRKSALRKAQLVSARKRKKGIAVKVGILASGVAVGALGYKYKGHAANIATDLKGRAFRFANPGNSLTGQMTPEWKEANMAGNAVSPPSAARQAPPVNSPQMGGTTPQGPNQGKARMGFGGAAASGPTQGAKALSVTQLPKGGTDIDPYGTAQMQAARDPNQRTPHPLAKGMTRERIAEGLRKAGVDPNGDVTWREIAVLAEVQAEYLNRTQNAGFKVSGPGRGNKSYNQFYRSLLDVYGTPSAGDLRRAQQGKA